MKYKTKLTIGILILIVGLAFVVADIFRTVDIPDKEQAILGNHSLENYNKKDILTTDGKIIRCLYAGEFNSILNYCSDADVPPFRTLKEADTWEVNKLISLAQEYEKRDIELATTNTNLEPTIIR